MTETERDVFDLLEPLDERPGPAARISSQRAAAMVRAAADRAAVVPEPVRVAPVRRLRVAMVAAAMVAAIGGASAAIYLATSGGERAPVEAPEPQPIVTPEPEAVEPLPDAAPTVELEAVESPPARATRPIRKPPVARVGAEDLLAMANERRGQRRWRDAATLYERVRREHAETTAAYVATVASADIQLQHLGKARRALALYRAAVRARPDGTLAAEARFGIAEAHRALGDGAAELEALEAFVAAHPRSLLRERAEQRLRALERERR